MTNKETTQKTNWKLLEPLFKRKEVKAKTILLEEGKVARTLYFIEKGCLRTWVSSEGKDITTQFFFEGEGVSSIESFLTTHPSLLTIESIEPCVVQTVSRKGFHTSAWTFTGTTTGVAGTYFPKAAFNASSRCSPTCATVRRKALHRASYLGITAVSLSRIRNRR